MRTPTAAVLAVLSLVLMLAAPAAQAQAQAQAQEQAQVQKVQIQVEVVLVSNKGDSVDPPELAKMKETFRRQNFNFTSFKRLSQEMIEVDSQKSTQVRLPNGVNASLKLLGFKEGMAVLRVDIPKLSAMEVELGREASVYQKAGKHVGGELILVLSPPAK
ncbi:MAG: hypothetical protein JXB05_06700 [Myxococcaceae bacterium]|nr:hypothetical protein [Myxococcaceae bacterium]